MSKKQRAILQVIVSSLIIFFVMSVYIMTFLAKKSETYEDKTLVLGSAQISYPYFGDDRDSAISNLINDLVTDNVDDIKYVVNFLGKYTNVLFKLYHDELIVGYHSILFNPYYEEVQINELILSNEKLFEKMMLYVRAYKMPLSVKELDNAKKSFLFKDYGVEIYLTNYNRYGHIALIDLDYHEIKDSLQFPYKLSKNYVYLHPNFTRPTTKNNNPNIILEGEPKLIAFTFDDGPSGYTLDLLDALDAFGAKATFFLTGYSIKARNSVVIETLARGHEIGNHTTDHTRLTKLKEKQIHDKLNNNNELFRNITNQDMLLVRPPYGSVNDRVKAAIKAPIILWSVDTRDWESRNTDKVVKETLKYVKEGDIVLFHDLYPTTIEAVSLLLPILYADNYQIVTVSDLFADKEIVLEKGVIYRHAR